VSDINEKKNDPIFDQISSRFQHDKFYIFFFFFILVKATIENCLLRLLWKNDPSSKTLGDNYWKCCQKREKDVPIDYRQRSYRRRLKNVPCSVWQRFSYFWQRFATVVRDNKWCSGRETRYSSFELVSVAPCIPSQLRYVASKLSNPILDLICYWALGLLLVQNISVVMKYYSIFIISFLKRKKKK